MSETLPDQRWLGDPNICVMIPAINEDPSRPLVVPDLLNVARVIVVDIGSTDTTARVAANCGAHVVHEPRRGDRSACRQGLAELKLLQSSGRLNVSAVVFVDADYSDQDQRDSFRHRARGHQNSVADRLLRDFSAQK